MNEAIKYHSQRASLFSAQHDRVAAGEYFSSPFAYGRWRIRIALAQLLPRSGSGLFLVDVGCGTGEEIALFAELGYEVLGVEPAEGMRSEALRRHPELAGKIVEGTGEAIPLGSCSADVVLSVEVLRYVRTISPFAREVARVLKPGGIWVFTVTPPSNWTLGPALNWLRCKGLPLPHVQPVPQYWHRASQVKQLLRREGLRLEVVLPASYLDFWAAVLCAFAPPVGSLWLRLLNPVWSAMERARVLPWVAGYYVMRAIKDV